MIPKQLKSPAARILEQELLKLTGWSAHCLNFSDPVACITLNEGKQDIVVRCCLIQGQSYFKVDDSEWATEWPQDFISKAKESARGTGI